MAEFEALRERWKYLYTIHLPMLARGKMPGQKWVVFNDHCFARIILDNVVGKDKPWTEVLKSPAIRNMSAEQLEAAITMAIEIGIGEQDLIYLNKHSLQIRGKQTKRPTKRKAEHKDAPEATKKRKSGEGTISSYFLQSPSLPPSKQETVEKPSKAAEEDPSNTEAKHDETEVMSAQLKRINDSNLTPFRKQTLSLLCQIPPGQHSTYQAMSDHITATSHKTCARAVGNAMRNNPFAPEVPCHRILAADGSLGGFGGHWGEEGKFASKKHELLEQEGVRFDSRGKVKGPVFRGWK